ncbi:hypothetical protein [Actinoplanes sp. NPDC026619]|uniref:hypothetical protein n=1 Tax=Actinoplanes sp. NPDC026619 TaxID=3155798 RepID=UPI0033FDBE77
MAPHLKGALIEFLPTGLIPIPRVISFQYNPETMTHTWTQPETAPSGANATVTNPYAVAHFPGEAFSFTLALDVTDPIADGTVSGALAEQTGVYSRIAALEMLLYPRSEKGGPNDLSGLLGTVTSGLASLFGGAAEPATKVPVHRLNTVLFVWGPGRIVPVRVTGLTITERLYDERLNPIHAEVQITLRVLTDEELRQDDTETGAVTVAKVANAYTEGLRRTLAAADQVNAAESIVGMLPL